MWGNWRSTLTLTGTWLHSAATIVHSQAKMCGHESSHCEAANSGYLPRLRIACSLVKWKRGEGGM